MAKNNIIPFPTEKKYNATTDKDRNFIGRRLAEARKKQKLTLNDLSDLLKNYGLDVSRAAISKWEMGGSSMNAYQILAVCYALKISDPLEFFCSSPAPQLNETGKKKLNSYRDDLIASGRYTPLPVAPDDMEYIEMPVSLLAASAGTGAFLDEGNFEMVSFPAFTVPKGADFGVRVCGNSMEPVYSNGQIVWVQQCNTLCPGEVGVFQYDGEGYIKVYDEREPEENVADFIDSNGVVHKQPVLVSYNKAYEPKPVQPNASFKICGRVL